MKKIILLSLLLGLFPLLVKSQICDIWIVTPTEQVLEVRSRGDLVFADSEYKLLMETAGVTRMAPAFPYSKVEKLKRVYTLRCPIQSIDIIGTSNLVVDIIELPNDSVELYVPTDPMWNNYYEDSTAWLWHLKKIQADLAWDITKGDSSVKIALLDTWFDPNHPDLAGQLQMPFDPYDNQPFYSSGMRNNHGTCVASFIAAETDGGGELSSIGFRCKIIPIKAHAGNYLSRAHFASLALNADVLTSSAGIWICDSNFNEIEHLAVKEILDNGTVIVMPAGNGLNSSSISHCLNIELGRDQPWRPLHPHYDERIIIVSSTDKDDMHYFEDNGIDNTHSHYPEVDICSPGYLTMGAQCTLDANNNPVSWPYYGFCNGTSFATPIVAGVCGLIKSLNPCFAPEDVQDIIKNSADPITDAADFPGLVGAGRINAYQALLLAQAYLVVDTITGNTTWNQKKHLYADLVIDSLATLTITDTLYIAGGTRIIVRPGGKLVVNGGTLTSACDGEMWEGIIEEGHNDIRQAALAQGSVILNNATIENAWTAISTRGADTNAIYEHTGGIVQATNTLFRNNRRSVEFLSYENHTTTHQVTNNASYFTRCTFTVDDDNLFVAQGRDFENHVTMWQVRGVKFNGCSFRNEMTGTSHRGKAVSTIEAGFNAKRVCPTISPVDPCVCENHGTDTVTRCSFIGFDTAVHTSSTLGNYDITLDNCDFRQNFRGVHLATADNDRISFCDFDLNHPLSDVSGIVLQNSTDYTVEGNSLHRNANNQTGTGIYFDNSGTAENVARLNDFTQLQYGCRAMNSNANNKLRQPKGLQFLCNSFSHNQFDIYINTDATIRRIQGSSTAGADNVFDHTLTNSLTIPSTHASVTYYRSSGGNHQPIGTSNYTVQNATANGCGSTICGIHIDNPIVPGLKGGALPQYRSMAEHLGHLQEQYENIQDLESEEAVALQSEMSDLSAAMSELARAEIRGIISDSVPDLDMLKDWYKSINTPLSHYLMAETQSIEGLWDKARATLEDIPVRFELDDSEKDEYTQYGSLQSLREAVYGNWYKLSDSQIAEMQQVAESSNGRAARMAKEILCFFHHICYEEAPFWDEIGQPEFGTRGLAVGKAGSDNALTLSPNPANSTVTLQLADPQDQIRQITVANMQGQVMLSQTVNATTPYTLDISSLPAGIYAVRVLTANGNVATGKMVKE